MDNKIGQIKIGTVTIEKTACLAPMASVADRAYRALCKEFGAAYLVSEMISAKGLCYGDKKTRALCEVTAGERPMALQLFGEDAEYVGKAAYLLGDFSPDIIDLNMGCPVPKIVSQGSGSALMKNIARAAEIAAAAVKNAACPVTAKIRAGWDAASINAVELAKALEQAGVAAVAVHGRTKTQMYAGEADWSVIRAVKDAVKIPVIGNGDVKTAQDCAAMYEQAGCDLVMIGRGSYGRPWVFEQVREFIISGKLLPEPDYAVRVAVMKRHAAMICENNGEGNGMREARKCVAWYLKGMPNSAALRGKSSTLETLADLDKLAEEALCFAAKTESGNG
ncbi:MAG: tRNA dihydrouridine synthase DusB [Oscillospiraceae bacterium]